jgi:hypothetical protein
MELTEMKSLWENMSQKIDQQKVLTDPIIKEMTKKRYSKEVRFITISESIGIVVAISTLLYLLLNFDKLDTWYFMVFGIIAILTLLVMPIVSLKSMKILTQINIANDNYKQSLTNFAKGKKQHLLVQQIGAYLSIPIFLIFIILTQKIVNNNDLLIDKGLGVYWYVIPIGIAFQFLVSKWILLKHKKTINSAETILEELKP